MTDISMAGATDEPLVELAQAPPPPSTVVPFPAPPKPPASAPINEFDVVAAPQAMDGPINEFDIEGIKKQETGIRARASVISAQGSNPDAAAKALALSRKTGMPASAIEADPSRAQRRVALNEFDVAPEGVQQWVAQDPINARLANDDYESLGLLERGWNEIKRGFYGQREGVQALGATVAGQRMADLEAAEAKQARGDYLTPVEKSMLAQAPQARANAEAASGQSIGKLLENKRAAEAIPMRPALRELNDAKTWGEAWSALSQDPLGIIFDLTAGNLPQLVTSTAATVVGGPVAGVATMGGMSFAQEFVGGILDNMQELGVKTDDPEALRAAFANSELMATVYRKSTIKASIVGTLDAATMGIAGKTLAPAAVKGRLAREAVNMPAQLAAQMAGGAGGEALGSVAAGNEVKPGAVLAEAVAELGSAPADVAAMRGFGKVKKPASPEQQQAEAQAMGLDKMVADAQASKLATRSPEKLEEFLSTVTGPDQNVFIPAEAVQAYFQSQPIEDVKAMSDALGITDQLSEALARGGDIVIPLSKYVTESTRSDIHKAWREDVRMEADGFSIRQAQEDAKVRDARVKEAVANFEKQLEAGIAEVEAKTRVYEDFLTKLKSVGFTAQAAQQQAVLMSERAATRAARSPEAYTDAWDAYQKAGLGTGLDIRSKLSERVAALPPDRLDVLLNSIKSGKEPRLRKVADRPPPQTHPALVESLRSALPDSGKVPDTFKPDTATMTTARRLARGWGPEKHVSTPVSLSEFVRARGGIDTDSNEAGDLKAVDLGKVGLLKKKRKGNGKGLKRTGYGADDMAVAAADAGYDLGPDTGIGNGVDAGRFMEMLAEDAGGQQKHYPEDSHTSAWRAQQEYFEQYDKWLKKDIEWEPKGRPAREVAWFLSQDEDTQRLMALAEQVDRLDPNTSLEALYLIDSQLARIEREALDRLAVTKERPEGWDVELDEAQSEVETSPLTLQEFRALHAELDRIVGDEESIGRGAEPVDEAGSPARSGGAASGNVPANGPSREAAGSGQAGGLSPADSFRADRADLLTALSDLGLDPKRLSNAQIRAAIKAEVDRRAKGRTLEQPVYHGGPHIFDRFSLDKIGTGEGAQAFGWGLYFAGKKAVAQAYRRMLAKGQTKFFVDGNEVDGALSAQEAIRSALVVNARDSGAPVSFFTGVLTDFMVAAENGQDIDRAKYAKSDWSALANQIADEVETRVKVERPGRLYHVEIPDDGAYLHWDKPLSEQSPEVKAALEKMGVKAPTPPALPRNPVLASILRRALKQNEGDPRDIALVVNNDAALYKLAQSEAGAKRLEQLDLSPGEWVEKQAKEYLDGLVAERAFTGEKIYKELSERLAKPPPDEMENPDGPRGWGMVINTRDGKLADDKAASLALREAGIPGIQYLDGSSRSDGEGSHNYVLFDDSLAEIKSYEQSATQRELVAVHNLSAKNLAHAHKMGGIAAPSMAVIKGENAFDGFGEISLIAPKSLIDPRENATSKVFGSDVYSARYPQVTFKIKYSAVQALQKRLAPLGKLANDERFHIDADDLERNPIRQLEENPAVQAEFLIARGMEPAYGENKHVSQRKMQMQIADAGLTEEFNDHVERVLASLDPVERIFKGFTDRGARYIPHTIQNVLREMTRTIRDAEGFNYGVGSIRSKVTQQFRSIQALKKADHKIVSKEDFAKVKEEVNNEFVELANEAQTYNRQKGFGFMDTFSEHLKEIADGVSPARVLKEYYDGAPDELGVKMADFLNKLRNMPTEYFEAKIKRSVGLNEFAGAVVPDDATPRTLKMLADNGITDIKTYKRSDPADRARAVREFQDTQFFQEARGQITFADNLSTITLFQGRDLSTLLHEVGHLWLEELGFDAKSQNAPDKIKADYQTVLDWLGSKDGYITTEMHEQFARGIETYLMEGKAPSTELRSAFQSFKRWLIQIYKRLTALNSPITPEIRAVFDRLIATDEQIAAAQNKQGLNPVLKDAESLGMTKAVFNAYTKQANAVVEEAEQKLLQAKMAEIEKQQKAEWKSNERLVREDVTNEVMSESGMQALELLTKGEFPVGTTPEVLKGIKLTKEDIVDLYGDESVLTLLPSGIYRDRSAGPGAMSPDELAPLLGLDSGTDLIERLMQLEAQHKAMAARGDKRSVARARIDEGTAERMTERYGDPLDAAAIEQEAMAAVHSDKQAALMSFELGVLARKAGHTGTISWQDIQTWAATAIGEKTVREGTQSQQYLRAERTAGRKVEQALVKGDFVAAFKAKQDQLVNLALYRESTKAAEEADSARKLMDRYASAATIKSMDQDYLEQIHQLLEEYEFKTRPPGLLAERKSFETWAAEQKANGVEVDPPPRLAKGLGLTNYRDMTVDELRGLTDTVKQIAHLGRNKKTLIDAGKKREFEAGVAEAVATAEAQPQRGVSGDDTGLTPLQEKIGKLMSGLRGVDASLLKMENLFEWMDGDKTGRGIFTRIGFRPFAEAQGRERDRVKGLTEKLADIHAKVPQIQRDKWLDIHTLATLPKPNGSTKWNKTQIIAMALNIGNESNLTKLLDGYKWDEVNLRAVLDAQLTKEEWQFVQDVWDLIETQWPELAAVHRRVNGVEPPKIERTPVKTPFGTLAGGYYKVGYDRNLSIKAEAVGERAETAATVGQIFPSGMTRPTTRAGATHERTGFVAPIRLSMDLISQQLVDAAHDIEFREAVLNAHKFFSDERIRQSIRDAVGPEYERMIAPWLQNIAHEWQIDRQGLNDVQKFASVLRTNVTIVGLGFRLSTMLAQSAGYANSVQRLGPAAMAAGLKTFALSPIQQTEWVRAKSSEMRHRSNDLERDMRAAQLKLQGKTGMINDVRRLAFQGIAFMDASVSVPTWLGAYQKGLKDGMVDEEAVYFADKMVRDTQGSGAAKDMAAIQRGGPILKLFTMFYSYFNVLYNRQRGIVRDAREGHWGSAVNQTMFLMVISPLLGQFLTGQGPDDDEEFIPWAVRNAAFGVFTGIPWVRDIANAGSAAVGGKNFGGAKLSPVQGFGDNLIHLFKDFNKMAAGEDASPSALKNAFNVAGVVTALPLGQVGQTSQFLWDALIEGSQNPESLKDWLSGLAFGPERK